jgi:hypothetical protein
LLVEVTDPDDDESPSTGNLHSDGEWNRNVAVVAVDVCNSLFLLKTSFCCWWRWSYGRARNAVKASNCSCDEDDELLPTLALRSSVVAGAAILPHSPVTQSSGLKLGDMHWKTKPN